jgi:hypothetical protein
MSTFKEASKVKLRFSTSKGSLSVEQLWELTQTELATCIKNVKKSLKKGDTEDDLSFLDSTTTVDTTEQLRFDILKEVYLTKKSESEALRNAKEIKEHNQKIMELISSKKETELQSKSVDELMALLK